MKMHTFFLSGKAIAIVSGAFGACAMLLFISGVLVGVRVQVSAPHGPSLTTQSAAVAETKPVAQPAGPVAEPAAAVTPAASGAGGVAGAAAAPSSSAPAPATPTATAAPSPVGTTADASDASASAAWPFTSSSFAPSQYAPAQTAPLETESAPLPAANESLPSQSTPAVPAPTRRVTMGDVSMIAYAAPTDGLSDVSADAATPRPSPKPAPRDDAQYLVQVGIFRVEQHARELVDRLNNAGYRATITERQEGDRALHVVRVGRFTGIDAAEKVAARISGSEQLVASVVAAPR